MLNLGSNEKVLKNIKSFIVKHRDLFTREEYFAFQRKMHALIRGEVTYRELKDLENSLLRYVSRLWSSSLTKFDDYDEENDFKFLVTCPTEAADTFDIRGVVSTSLISNKHIGTFNKTPIALVLEIEDDAILGISNRDMNSVVDDGSYLDGNYFYMNQYDGKDIYTKFQVDSLISPDDIESSLVNQNIQANGNILYLGEKSVYSDILVKGKKVKVVGVLVMSHANGIWRSAADILAKKFNVGVKQLDVEHYYRRVGIVKDEVETISYNMSDITLIEGILKGTFRIENGKSNLFVERVGRKVVVRSYDSPDYLMIDYDEGELSIIIKGDYQSIKLNYDGKNINYSIDGEIVNRDAIENILCSNEVTKGK